MAAQYQLIAALFRQYRSSLAAVTPRCVSWFTSAPKVCVLPKFGIEREVRVCDSCFEQYGPAEEEQPESPAPQVGRAGKWVAVVKLGGSGLGEVEVCSAVQYNNFSKMDKHKEEF